MLGPVSRRAPGRTAASCDLRRGHRPIERQLGDALQLGLRARSGSALTSEQQVAIR